jgi:tetratricopeptide (TPR) repeat protein
LLRASELDPRFDPVVQSLRTALNLASVTDSASEGFVIIGRGLGLAGEWELARTAFEQAAQENEKNAEAWAWLAEANQQTAGNDALVLLDRALHLDPASSTVHSLRGLYFQRTGNYRDALTEFQSAARLDMENPSLFVSLGDAYAMTGDLIRGLQAYQYATELAPEDATYWLLLASFCAENNINLSDVGIPAAQKAVVLSQEAPETLGVLGWTLLLGGRFPEAEQILLRALEADPQNASAHFHLGVVYLQKNERAQAYAQLIHARDLGSMEADLALRQYFPQ